MEIKLCVLQAPLVQWLLLLLRKPLPGFNPCSGHFYFVTKSLKPIVKLPWQALTIGLLRLSLSTITIGV